MEELAVGDTKYKIGIHKTQAGFSITWNLEQIEAALGAMNRKLTIKVHREPDTA